MNTRSPTNPLTSTDSISIACNLKANTLFLPLPPRSFFCCPFVFSFGFSYPNLAAACHIRRISISTHCSSKQQWRKNLPFFSHFLNKCKESHVGSTGYSMLEVTYHDRLKLHLDFFYYFNILINLFKFN